MFRDVGFRFWGLGFGGWFGVERSECGIHVLGSEARAGGRLHFRASSLCFTV